MTTVRRLAGPAFLLPLLLLLGVCVQVSAAVAEPVPTLEQALDQLGRYRFPEARQALALVRQAADPASETWRRATYGLALAHQHEPAASAEMTATAKTLHDELWQRGTGTPEAVHAAIQLGRIAHLRDYFKDQPDLSAARDWYGKAIAAAGSDVIASQAVIYLASAWIEELTPDGFAEAERVLTGWLSAHPQDPQAALLWMTLAELRHVYRNDPKGAVEALRLVDQLHGPISLHWKVVWRMGAIAQDELKDRELAVACFRAIATNYLRSGKADAARARLVELGVEPPPLPKTLWENQGEPGPVKVIPLAAVEAKP